MPLAPCVCLLRPRACSSRRCYSSASMLGFEVCQPAEYLQNMANSDHFTEVPTGEAVGANMRCDQLNACRQVCLSNKVRIGNKPLRLGGPRGPVERLNKATVGERLHECTDVRVVTWLHRDHERAVRSFRGLRPAGCLAWRK